MDSETPTEEIAPTRKSKINYFGILFVAVIAGLIIFADFREPSAAYLNSEAENPFPKSDKIEEVILMWQEPIKKKSFERIIPWADYKELREKFENSREDPEPMDWTILPERLLIKMNEGEDMEVRFYYTTLAVGAFSIDGIFYRGGIDDAMPSLFRPYILGNAGATPATKRP